MVLSMSFYSDALTSGTLLTLERLTSKGQTIPRDSKGFICEHAFHLQTNQSRAHTPHSIFSGLFHSRPLFPCPNHSGPGTRQLETDPIPKRPMKLFQLTNPKPAYLVLSYLLLVLCLRATQIQVHGGTCMSVVCVSRELEAS